ncbi:unnamed protein product, partial [Boreogadus saida]
SIEVYHNVTLKYAPNRLHFTYDSMKARIDLRLGGPESVMAPPSGPPQSPAPIYFWDVEKTFAAQPELHTSGGYTTTSHEVSSRCWVSGCGRHPLHAVALSGSPFIALPQLFVSVFKFE